MAHTITDKTREATNSTALGASDDAASASGVDAGQSIFARIRYWFTFLFAANGTGIGQSDDNASASLVDASKSLFARLRYGFEQVIARLGAVGVGNSDDAAAASLVDSGKSVFARLRYGFGLLGTPAGASVSADIAAVKGVVDLVATAANLLLCTAAAKRREILFGNGTVTKSTTSYLSSPWSGTTASTTTPALVACARDGTLSNLKIKLSTNSDRDTTYRVLINGAASGLTVTILAAATSGEDVTHTAAISAGDRISFESVNVAGAAADQTGVTATLQLDLT